MSIGYFELINQTTTNFPIPVFTRTGFANAFLG
jgi:hypothetical protein